MDAITIRKFRDSDREAVDRITVEGFEKVSIDNNMDGLFPPVKRPDWRVRKLKTLHEELRTWPEHCFVAECGGEVAGYITCSVDYETLIGRILNLAVDSRFRGRGIGKKLLQHALEHFSSCGMEIAKIETLEQNEIGKRFYPSMGFREIARQIHYAMPLKGGNEG